MHKKISILIISGAGMKSRNYTVSQFTLRILLGIFICIMGGAVWLIFQYGSIVGKDLKIRALRRENQTMREQYSKLQQFEAEFNEFKRRILKIANALDVKETVVSYPKVAFTLRDTLPTLTHTAPRRTSVANPKENIAVPTKVEQEGELPTISPVKGWITQRFSSSHTAVDFATEFGASVVSTINGNVEFTGERLTLGKVVEIINEKGFKIVYGHLARTTVVKGTRVKQGDLIGYAGSTGESSAPHLHYEVKFNGIPHDPERYLPK